MWARTWFCGLALLLLSGCTQPTVNLEIEKSQSGTDFVITTAGVNGLLALRVMDEKSTNTLWALNLNYFPEGRITYGSIPRNFTAKNGQKSSAEQLIPTLRKKPEPLPTNATLRVEITAQYDRSMAPSATTFYLSLQTDAKGNVSMPGATH